MSDGGIRSVIVGSIVAFFLGVPLIYALVLLAQLPLLAWGLGPFGAHAWFVKPALGALLGTGVSLLLNIRATFSVADEPGSDISRARLHQRFLFGLVLQVPVAFLIAALVAAPENNSTALIVIGAMRGMVAAAVAVVFTVLVYHEAVRTGWGVIVIIEIMLVFGGLIGGLSGHVSGDLKVVQTLELVLPAIVACALTYGLADLIETLLRPAPTMPAAGPDLPAPQPSTVSVQRPGHDRNRGRTPGQRHRPRRSKRRPRRRR